MNEQTLSKISLVFAIAGIGLIYIANKSFESEVIAINDVSETMNYMTIRGKINEKFTSKSETVFLKVSDDSGTIDVVIFKNSLTDIGDLKVGMNIEVSGKPDIYRGKIEIIANRIQVLNSDLV